MDLINEHGIKISFTITDKEELDKYIESIKNSDDHKEAMNYFYFLIGNSSNTYNEVFDSCIAHIIDDRGLEEKTEENPLYFSMCKRFKDEYNKK